MLQILLDELIFADFKIDEFLDVLWRYNIYKYKQ